MAGTATGTEVLPLDRFPFGIVTCGTSKYPPAEPGALGLEPLKAACPCRTNLHSYSHREMPLQGVERSA
jgi:hypothetical protein